MRYLCRGIALLGLLAPCLAAAQVDENCTIARELESGGRTRSYRLHVPPSYNKAKPAPLVLACHGGGGNAWQMERFSRFNTLADREGFIVIYPDALEGNWNDGRAAQNIFAQRENIDDVGFIRAVLAQVSKEFSIDRRRIYATGISNGAFFSHLLALKLPQPDAPDTFRLAAIAPVVGGIAEPVAKDFNPPYPVSVLIIQGTHDPLVPFDGGGVARKRGRVVATPDAVKAWVNADGCNNTSEESELPDKEPDDGTHTRVFKYSGGKNGSEVILYVVENGGHTWPGGAQYLPEFIIGKTPRDFDGTETIWAFFKAYGRE